MGLPIKIVTMDRLMKRWNMSFNDMFLIALRQDLMPVYKEYPDQSWQKYETGNDLIGVFTQKEANASQIVFLRSDVEKLEQTFGGQIAKSAEVINESDLMVRWGSSKIELWQMKDKYSLNVTDPLGTQIEEFDWLMEHFFIGNTSHGELFVYFRLSEIEKVEKEHGIEPKTIIASKEKKLRPNQLHRKKCREVAKKLWQKNPQMTIVDMAHHDEITEACDGHIYTEETIRRWIKDLCPNRSRGRRPKKV